MSKARKKVLIISYYWPPSGGIGVLRCLKIAKYLREFGWEPIIYTAQNAHYPSYDDTNFKDIPEGITILKQPIFEPYKYYKKFTGKAADSNVNNDLVAASDKGSLKHSISVWIRSNFFIPDARAFWIKPSVRFLKKYLQENKVDAIFSDGPPHTNTMIACRLKQTLGIPWLADFQDPWTQVDYFQRLILTPWGRKKHHKMEQSVFRAANHITIVSHAWRRDLMAIGAKKVSVIPWGYDQDDYRHLHYAPDWKFTLTHTGLIGDDRNPEGLFKALRELADEIPDFAALFKLQLAGQIDRSVEESIARYRLADMCVFMGQLSRPEALRLVANSQVLLLLLNQADNSAGRIPGKLFEYLAVRRPILCLGNTEGDVADILQECDAGLAIEHHDTEAIKTQLSDLFIRYKTYANLPHNPASEALERYTNRALTSQIADILDSISGY